MKQSRPPHLPKSQFYVYASCSHHSICEYSLPEFRGSLLLHCRTDPNPLRHLTEQILHMCSASPGLLQIHRQQDCPSQIQRSCRKSAAQPVSQMPMCARSCRPAAWDHLLCFLAARYHYARQILHKDLWCCPEVLCCPGSYCPGVFCSGSYCSGSYCPGLYCSGSSRSDLRRFPESQNLSSGRPQAVQAAPAHLPIPVLRRSRVLRKSLRNTLF